MTFNTRSDTNSCIVIFQCGILCTCDKKYEKKNKVNAHSGGNGTVERSVLLSVTIKKIWVTCKIFKCPRRTFEQLLFSHFLILSIFLKRSHRIVTYISCVI